MNSNNNNRIPKQRMLRASAALLQLTAIYDNDKDLAPSHAPYAFFLELDELGILLDCGWDSHFSVDYLEKLRPYAQRADAVLLSSPHLNACGALPFVLKHLKPQVFVFAAASTAKVGLHGLLHPFLYNFPNSCTLSVDGEAFELTTDSIYSAFRSIREPFGGKVVISSKNASSVECLMQFASRMLGGYAWTIKYQIDEIFYCPDYSLKASYSLKPFLIPTSPNIVLLESFSAQKKDTRDMKKRNEEELLQELFKQVQYTLRSGGDVLIPVDVPGRGIEILSIIIHLLQEKGGDKYKVVLGSIQAKEVMDKACTMTEALQDGIILQESGLFSSVIPCKTAEEVRAVGGPKVCVADGSSMDSGIAGELLSYFLTRNEDGGANLIVLPDRPSPGTNAFKVFSSVPNDILQYDLLRRCSLNREELEEYYINLEREVEERRKELQTENIVAVNEDLVSDEEDEGEADDGEKRSRGVESHSVKGQNSSAEVGGGSEESGKKINSGEGEEELRTPHPGLYTFPHPLKQKKQKHLQFAVLASSLSLYDNTGKIDISYGIPIGEEEELLMKKIGSTKSNIINDEGPESLQLVNDAQTEANLPSKICVESFSLPRECKVFFSDLSGYPEDVHTVRSLLKSKFSFAKKIVCLRGNVTNYQFLSKICRAEKSMKCGENVYYPHCDVPVKLDTPIFSFTVRLDPRLEQQLPWSMKRVRDSQSQGDWEVGWVDGSIYSLYSTKRRSDAHGNSSPSNSSGGMANSGGSPGDGHTSSEYPQLEVGDAANSTATNTTSTGVTNSSKRDLVMTAVSDEQIEACMSHCQDELMERGSFFVGHLELNRLRDATKRELQSDFYQKAPLLLYDEGVCVRRSNNGGVTIASMPTPAFFNIRRSVYNQFYQVL